MVLAPTVDQSLGLAGAASGSCVGSAFDFLTHYYSLQFRLVIAKLIKATNLAINQAELAIDQFSVTQRELVAMKLSGALSNVNHRDA